MNALGELMKRIVEQGEGESAAKALRIFFLAERVEMVSVKHKCNIDRWKGKVGKLKAFKKGILVVRPILSTFWFEHRVIVGSERFRSEHIGAIELETVSSAIEIDVPTTFSEELLAHLGLSLISFLLSRAVTRLGADRLEWLRNWMVGWRGCLDAGLVDVTCILVASGIVKVLSAVMNSLT